MVGHRHCPFPNNDLRYHGTRTVGGSGAIRDKKAYDEAYKEAYDDDYKEMLG